MAKIRSSEITPEHFYISRRRFIKGAGALAAGSLILAACGDQGSTPAPLPSATAGPTATAAGSTFPPLGASADELGAALTPYEAVINYNNFYEFTTSKEGVAGMAGDFRTSPWAVEVGGLVNKPRTFDIDDLLKFTQEER